MPAAKAKGQRIRAGPCFLCEPFRETKLARLVEFIHAACHMRLDRFSRIGSHFGQQRTHFLGFLLLDASPQNPYSGPIKSQSFRLVLQSLEQQIS